MATRKAKKNEVATKSSDALPDYLKDKQGQGSGLTGLDAGDFIVPRIKLMQAISPEVEDFNEAKPGMFWLNVLDKPLSEEGVGSTLRFIPITNKKRYLLMAPRADGRGILARSDDAIHWSPPDAEWQVKLKGVRNPVTWRTAPTVAESGLAEFGSSNPDDPDSNPAATLFYEYLVMLPDHPELGPVLLSLSRSQARKARDLNGKIEMRNIPMQGQMFVAKTIKEEHADGDYYNYSFAAAGFSTEEQYETCVRLADQYTDFRGADEESMQGEGDKPKAESNEY